MGRKGYSLDQFKVDRYQGLLYNHPKDGWMGASERQERWYNKQTKPKTNTKKLTKRGGQIAFVKSKFGKYFTAGTKFTTEQGHIKGWARPLAVKGGTKSVHNWGRVNYRDIKKGRPQLFRTGTSNLWGTEVNSKSKATVLNGFKGMAQQLAISIYAVRVQASNFRVMVGKRALKVFQNSFKYRQFHSRGEHKWQTLSDFTKKKRASRGTGNRVLKEYGDLYKSIKLKTSGGRNKTQIFTEIVSANAANHKKHSICYAGYHNEGVGTYGKGFGGRPPKPYVQRQFIGFSTYLNPFLDSFMRKMMKRYLFDSVFLTKK